VITGTAGDPGGPVSVQAVDANNVPLTAATGTVTLAKTAGSFTSSGGFSGTQANLVNGVATFSGFKSTATGTSLMVQASSPGYMTTPLNEGGPFNITSTGASCIGLDPCLLDSNFGNSPVNASATGGAFTFLGLNASSVPASVIAPGGGCQYFVSVGAGAFEAVDNRTAAGELRFTYNVPTKLIQKSPNNGQPFIPLCAGSQAAGEQPAGRLQSERTALAIRTARGSAKGSTRTARSTAACATPFAARAASGGR
jgi:hypothetical protein